MSDIDPLDIEALEGAVNSSALSVSTIWLSFLVFEAYLVATAAGVTQSQLLTAEGSINIPTVNIELPLVPSFIFLPLTLVIFHVYLLLQVLLLARTAAVYNEAVESSVRLASDSVRIRQRLANTLFAQLFAGSPRERGGLPGILLRTIAWVTLIVAPVLVLLLFQVQFLAYHSLTITWVHRLLAIFDLVAVIVLWAGASDAARDISWRAILGRGGMLLAALVFIFLSLGVLTFPGEPMASLTRYEAADDPTFGSYVLSDCRKRSVLASLLPRNFDRLSLPGVVVANDESVKKLEEIALAKGKKPYEGERIGKFRSRNFRCANLASADLRLADFTGADIAGATFAGALLRGALFAIVEEPGVGIGPPPEGKDVPRTNAEGAVFDGADLRDAYLLNADLDGATLLAALLQDTEMSGASLDGVNLSGANLQNARLELAHLNRALLQGASFQNADLREATLQGSNGEDASFNGATLTLAQLQDSYFWGADFQGASFEAAGLQGANLGGTRLQGAVLDRANMQGSDLYSADLRGASLSRSLLQGARLDKARLQGARLTWAELQGSNLLQVQLQGAEMDQSILNLANIAEASLWRTNFLDCPDAQVTEPDFLAHLERPKSSGAGQDINAEVSPAMIDAFINEALKSVPDELDFEGKSMRGRARSRMLAYLNVYPDGDRTSELKAQWQACALSAKPADQYKIELATFLAKLVCDAPSDQPPIAEGIYRNWVNKADPLSPHGDIVFRAMLGLDGRPCPGAKSLSKETLDSLREIAGLSQPN